MENNEALQYLEDWFKTHCDPDKKNIYIEGKLMSASGLMDEVRNETEIGLKYLETIINLGNKGELPQLVNKKGGKYGLH